MYYMRFNNDDGSWEEFEVQQGHIYCKCHICGKEYAPARIEFDQQCDFKEEYTIWNCCPECFAKHEAEESSKRSYIALAKELSRSFKREITPEEIHQFLVDYKGAGCDIIGAAVQERFGNGPSSDLKRKRQRKPQIAQQAKSITIITASKQQ